MIFDLKRANELLVLGGDPSARTMSMYVGKDALMADVFKSVVNLRYGDNYDVSDDIDEEICDFPDNVKFEMKDLTFCLIEDDEHWSGACILLYVSLKSDTSWDQHMEVPVIDDDADFVISMEQAWKYRGDMTIDELRADLEAKGGTYDKSMEQYFVE